MGRRRGWSGAGDAISLVRTRAAMHAAIWPAPSLGCINGCPVIVVPVLALFCGDNYHKYLVGYMKQRPSFFYSSGASGSAGLTGNDAFPQAEREWVVAGALIEDPAWLRDESFDLDLIGFNLDPMTRRFEQPASNRSWALPDLPLRHCSRRRRSGERF
jgi:hypothetical protein